jgi:predicted acylesterase/phospholipase RssA
MKQFWADASKQPLYQNWWVGPWAALISSGGIYDPSPLKAFLTSELSKLEVNAQNPLYRALNIGILDVLKGTYLNMNDEIIDKSNDSLIDTLFSSFATPGFFPPAKAFNTEVFDGSSVNTLDVFSAIRACSQMPGVESESDIVVDVILT